MCLHSVGDPIALNEAMPLFDAPPRGAHAPFLLSTSSHGRGYSALRALDVIAQDHSRLHWED